MTPMSQYGLKALLRAGALPPAKESARFMIRHLKIPAGSAIPFTGRVELICFGLIIAQAVFLIAMYGHGLWLVRPDGSIPPSDFTYFWTAGRQLLAGHDAIG